MSIDVMKQALEALEEAVFYTSSESWSPSMTRECETAITALRAAIEQAQDPETELETYKRLYELRGKALERPCSNCGHQPAKIKAMAQPEQEPIAWVYQEGLEALKSGRPWTAYGSSGEGRIPLYLNDAVAPRAEPRSGESGAGFESLPASPKWQGLTDAERGITAAETWGSVLIAPQSYQAFARAIEAKLKEKNT